MAAGAGEEPTEEIDGAEMERGWHALQAARPSRHARIVWGARSEIGLVRENNEDKFDFFLSDDPPTLAARGRLWAVADGMGGHNAGQVASETALRVFVREYFDSSTADIEAAMRSGIDRANNLLYQAASRQEDRKGMGTTLTAAVIREDVLTVAHVGDSRIYLLRDGTLRQLTTDHTWVEDQIRRGALTAEEANRSPYRNMLTRSIGMGEGCDPDIVSETLLPGDTLLLCSDGLSGFVDESAIATPLREMEPARAAMALTEAANRAGGRDNVTAVVLRVRSIDNCRDDPPTGA